MRCVQIDRAYEYNRLFSRKNDETSQTRHVVFNTYLDMHTKL